MRKALILSVTAAAVLTAASVTATASDLYGSCGESAGKIYVTGQGEIKVQPDRVLIDYRVSSLKQSPAEARAEVEKTVNAFVESVKSVKLPKDGLFAGDISVFPRYDYKDNKQTLLGYEASRSVQVKLEDFSQISNVNDLAMSSGINQIAGMNYQISDPEKYRAEAAQRAMQSVKDQVAMLADGFKVRAERPCAINYSTNTGAAPVYRNVKMSVAYSSSEAAEEKGSVYAPEPVVVRATISAEYAIADDE